MEKILAWIDAVPDFPLPAHDTHCRWRWIGPRTGPEWTGDPDFLHLLSMTWSARTSYYDVKEENVGWLSMEQIAVDRQGKRKWAIYDHQVRWYLPCSRETAHKNSVERVQECEAWMTNLPRMLERAIATGLVAVKPATWISVGLACNDCLSRDMEEQCTHMKFLLPSWIETPGHELQVRMMQDEAARQEARK